METYRPSGAVPIGGLLMATGAGVAAAIVLGGVYAYVCAYSPLIYLNILATLAFGGGIGYAIGKAAEAGKVRNPKVMFSVGLLASVFGLYTAWGLDPVARFKLELSHAAFEPSTLGRYMQFGYENGFWSIGKAGRNNSTVSGIFLAAVWLIEAGMVAFCAGAAAKSVSGAKPFCEECDRWTGTKDNVKRLANVTNVDASLLRLMSGDLTGLAEMVRAAPSAKAFLQLDLAVCPNCGKNNYLTVTRSETKKNSKGKDETTRNVLLANLRVPYEKLQLVLDAGREPTPIAPPSETVGDAPKAGDFNFS